MKRDEIEKLIINDNLILSDVIDVFIKLYALDDIDIKRLGDTLRDYCHSYKNQKIDISNKIKYDKI